MAEPIRSGRFMDRASMTSSSGNRTRFARHRTNNRWRCYRLPLILFVLLGLSIWYRGLWWPVPFQAAARNALSQHENDAALKWLDWATWLAREDSETAFLRARALRRIGQMKQSVAAWRRAKLLHAPLQRIQHEQWLGWAQSGKLREVGRHVPELLNDPRGDFEEISEAFFLGCVLTQNHAQAFQILQSWIDERPIQARPYLLRAKLWVMQSKLDNAENDLRRAVALDPGNAEAAVELASKLQIRNRFEDAIPLFQRSLNAPHFAVRAHIGLAVCLKCQGESGRIRPLLERAVKLAPENPQALCELGRFELETGQFAAAVLRSKEAVRVSPRDEDCHFVLAQALVADGMPEQAQPHFEFIRKVRDGLHELDRCEELLAKNPRDIDALIRAGTILLEVADPEEGLIRLNSALEIEPNHAVARKLIADYYTRRAKTNFKHH